eukprot:14971972-Alexandrium_andersonii.AAC.1
MPARGYLQGRFAGLPAWREAGTIGVEPSSHQQHNVDILGCMGKRCRVCAGCAFTRVVLQWPCASFLTHTHTCTPTCPNTHA